MTALSTGLLLAALAVTVLVAVAAAAVAARRARRSRRLVEERLAESRHEVGRLAEQVERLAAEVSAARQPAPEDHEYVITTLVGAQASAAGGEEPTRAGWPRERPRPGEMIEREAVARLAQVDTSTRLGARAADLGVRLVALGHGVRRALAQENRDRAAAAAHVARRRSRRTRREELREARRLVRAVRARQHLRPVDAPVERAEDVA